MFNPSAAVVELNADRPAICGGRGGPQARSIHEKCRELSIFLLISIQIPAGRAVVKLLEYATNFFAARAPRPHHVVCVRWVKNRGNLNKLRFWLGIAHFSLDLGLVAQRAR